eukprot:760579-Hanusia_phi.AAC.3
MHSARTATIPSHRALYPIAPRCLSLIAPATCRSVPRTWQAQSESHSGSEPAIRLGPRPGLNSERPVLSNLACDAACHCRAEVYYDSMIPAGRGH